MSQPSPQTMPLVKMRGDVRELSDSPSASFENQLFEADPLVHLGSPFAKEISTPEIASDVFDALESGEYDEERGAPPSLRPWMPWATAEAKTWTDGQVMAFGRVAEAAFEHTREECLRKARLAGSPYRKNGLSAAEAAGAERQRIERQKERPIPEIVGKVLPEKRGEHALRPLGYVCRRVGDGIAQVRTDNFIGLNLVFEVTRGKTVMVAKPKMDLLTQFVQKVFPTSFRENKISYRKQGGRKAPVEIYLEGKGGKTPETVAEELEVSLPPEALVGMVMPLTAAAERERQNLWKKLPEGIREGNAYARRESRDSTDRKRAQRMDGREENSVTQGELFGG